MVRLEGVEPVFDKLRQSPFQFLYGAIGSTLLIHLLSLSFCVSIPIWCDWKPEFCNCNILDTSVSIPIWCDWKQLLSEKSPKVCSVSIPIWCDWKWSCNPDAPYLPPFQFLYGAIGRKTGLLTPAILCCFNSYMVRLEEKCPLCTNGWFGVSIPIWCDWKKDEKNTGCKHRCFNSYMVRLEENPKRVWNVWSLVSIPIWCDWKASPEEWFFHVLNVSIPIWCDWKPSWPKVRVWQGRFNSYMVRLEEPGSQRVLH